MAEYTDAVDRARRLSQSCDLVLSDRTLPTSLVELDDVLPYLRWKVFQQHTTKYVATFLQVRKERAATYLVAVNQSLKF